MDEKIEIRCPSCQVKTRVPIVFIGKSVRCPTCKHVFEVTIPKELLVNNKSNIIKIASITAVVVGLSLIVYLLTSKPEKPPAVKDIDEGKDTHAPAQTNQHIQEAESAYEKELQRREEELKRKEQELDQKKQELQAKSDLPKEVDNKAIFLNKVEPLIQCMRKAYLELGGSNWTQSRADEISDEAKDICDATVKSLTETEKNYTSWRILREATLEVIIAKNRVALILAEYNSDITAERFKGETGEYPAGHDPHSGEKGSRKFKELMAEVGKVINTDLPEALKVDFGN